MNKGDVLLINVPFTNLADIKKRPVLLIRRHKDDLICLFFTTKKKNKHINDCVIHPSRANGLKVVSHIKIHKIFTLHKSLVDRKLGCLTKNEVVKIVKILSDFLKK